MRKLTLVVFVIALIVIAYETFRPQPEFPNSTSYVSNAAVAVESGQTAN